MGVTKKRQDKGRASGSCCLVGLGVGVGTHPPTCKCHFTGGKGSQPMPGWPLEYSRKSVRG